MNTPILQKCLDELEKESPKLDYVRGMLETLISLEPTRPAEVSNQELKTVLETRKVPVVSDASDAQLLDATAKAKLAAVQASVAQSTS